MTAARTQKANPVIVYGHFKKFKDIIDRNSLTADKIYNMDETGFNIALWLQKVLAVKNSRTAQRGEPEISRGNSVYEKPRHSLPVHSLKYPSTPSKTTNWDDDEQRPARPKAFKFATILTEAETLKKFQELEAAEHLREQEKIKRRQNAEQKRVEKKAAQEAKNNSNN